MDIAVDISQDLLHWFSAAVITDAPAETSIVVTIRGLEPNQRYFYRILYRGTNAMSWQIYHRQPDDQGIYAFHTQRSYDAHWRFTLDADSHHGGLTWAPRNDSLYVTMCNNAVADGADFHISLGDHIVPYDAEIQSYRDMLARHATLRQAMRAVSIPWFHALGNHERECGWHIAAGDSHALWSVHARLDCWIQPDSNQFYNVFSVTTPYGSRPVAYTWRWGDVRLYVLDPYWFTSQNPVGYPTGDPWRWTLGKEQYDWFYDVLQYSDAKWKIVCTHQLVGGDSTGYGRGGIEYVKHRIAGKPSYEWGGEDASGNNVFSSKRSGWTHGPIHDMLVDADVTAVVKAHDHAFVYQEIDGILYLTVPQTGCVVGGCYGWGFVNNAGLYPDSCSVKIRNAGHLRCTVCGNDSLIFEYVRAVREHDEPLVQDNQLIYNRTISWRHVVR